MAVLFNITHDAGNLNEYDATVVDGGDLSAGAPGLAGTTAKMEVLIDDANGIYGDKNQAAPASNEIRFRFYVDPNLITMGDGEIFFILDIRVIGAPWSFLFLSLRYTVAGGYYIKPSVQDNLGWHHDWTVTITDASHYVECHLERESGEHAGDGRFRMWVDGVLETTILNLQNFEYFALMDYFRVGADGIDVNTLGTIYLDELVANDDGSEIGPVAPPVGGHMTLWGRYWGP